MSSNQLTTANDVQQYRSYENVNFYRPSTSNPFRFPYKLNDPIGVSHYDQVYFAKDFSKPEPIRAGSATGNRNNRPQPTKEFIAYTYKPLKPVTNDRSPWSRDLTDDIIRNVMRDQLKSLYTSDYADIMRRVELANNSELNRSLPQLPKLNNQNYENTGLTTEQRFHYKKPLQPLLLRNPVTRFGSRK